MKLEDIVVQTKTLTSDLVRILEQAESATKSALSIDEIKKWTDRIETEAKDVSKAAVAGFDIVEHKIFATINYVIDGVSTTSSIIHDITTNTTTAKHNVNSTETEGNETVTDSANAPATADATTNIPVTTTATVEPTISLESSDLVADGKVPSEISTATYTRDDSFDVFFVSDKGLRTEVEADKVASKAGILTISFVSTPIDLTKVASVEVYGIVNSKPSMAFTHSVKLVPDITPDYSFEGNNQHVFITNVQFSILSSNPIAFENYPKA